MSWVTVIWSMIASASLTLGAIYWLVWYRNRTVWPPLFFTLTAAATTGMAFCELSLMRAATPGELATIMRWAHVPLFVWLVSITWFVWLYLGTGRRWLVWTICGTRACALLLNFIVGPNLNYREVTALRHVQFLGEPVTVMGGVVSRWGLVGNLGVLLVIIFVADASVAAWRRGDRRKALMVGGTIEFFLLFGFGQSALIYWANLQMPITLSLLYVGMLSAMGYELSRDVLRASELVDELRVSEAGLRESEARMSLAVDAANMGLWSQDIARSEFWASERWRELFGFAPSEDLEPNAILNRLHPDDREGVERAHAMAIAGADRGRYQTEFRLMLPDGAARWISSQGRLECDATGQPVLVRGVSRDVTASKRAELTVRNLSGRLLSAQEEERRRIARELHDHLSQRMAALAIGIGQVATRLGESTPAVARSMRELDQLAAEISIEIHSISHQLHSPKLELLGLAAALRAHCQELLALGFHARFHEEDVPRSLPPDVALCLFRIVQEGLTNVVKHSGAGEADVTLRVTGEVLVLSVADAGRGFDEAGAAVQDGLGLASMRERLRLIDGEFTVHSQPGRGTTISARVPIPAVAGKTVADPVGVA